MQDEPEAASENEPKSPPTPANDDATQRCPIVGVSETTTENEPGRPGDGKVLGFDSTTRVPARQTGGRGRLATHAAGGCRSPAPAAQGWLSPGPENP